MASPAYTVSNGAIFEATIRYDIAGSTCLNIQHFVLSGAGTSIDGPATLNTFLSYWDAADTGVSAMLAAFVTTDVKIRQIVGQWIAPTRYGRRVVPPQVGTGNVSGPTCPPNVDLVGLKLTDRAGRTGHGSIHISGIDLNSLGIDRWVEQTVTAAYDYCQALTNEATLSGGAVLSPIVYHRAQPSLSPLITNISVSSIPRTMRRRGLGLGI